MPELLEDVDVLVAGVLDVVDDGLDFDLDAAVVLGGFTFGLLFCSDFSAVDATSNELVVFVALAAGVETVLVAALGESIGVELADNFPCSVNTFFICNNAARYLCIWLRNSMILRSFSSFLV